MVFSTGRRFAGAVLLAVALLVLAGGSLAFAGKAVCRTDPIVTLSNGDVVTLYADFETDLSNIVSVDYVLHGPAGVSVVEVIHPLAETAALENFTYVPDGSSKQYSATTTARVYQGSKVPFITYIDLMMPGTSKVESDKRNGIVGQTLYTEVKRQ